MFARMSRVEANGREVGCDIVFYLYRIKLLVTVGTCWLFLLELYTESGRGLPI